MVRIQSFGRPDEPEKKPAAEPSATLTVATVLAVDDESLDAVAERITAMVARAVRAGFMQAISEIESGA